MVYQLLFLIVSKTSDKRESNLLINAKFFVADGIHQRVFPKGGRDLSFGENCRNVINCIIYRINDLNLSSSNLEHKNSIN